MTLDPDEGGLGISSEDRRKFDAAIRSAFISLNALRGVASQAGASMNHAPGHSGASRRLPKYPFSKTNSH